jgi:hypothetical protein
LPARVRNVLTAAGLKTVGEVREISDEIQDFAQGSLAYLRDTPKVEEGIVRTDAHSAGVLVTPLGQQVCWQMGENTLFDVPADQLRDLRPPPFRQGIERIVWLFVLGHSSAIRRGHSLRPLSKGGDILFDLYQKPVNPC